LSPELQQAVQKAMNDAIQIANKADAADESQYVKKLEAGGMAIYDPTPAELDQWRKAAMPVWDKFGGQMDQAVLARVQAIQKQ